MEKETLTKPEDICHTMAQEVIDMSNIKCTVGECAFNCADHCEAAQIKVRGSGCKTVKRADETACETFRSRGVSDEDCHC